MSVDVASPSGTLSGMVDRQGSEARVPVKGPWARATIAFQLVIFAIPAIVAWGDTLDSTYYLPVVSLAATFGAGVLMLAFNGWQQVGLRIAGASIGAAALEVVLTFLLVVAYSGRNPGWDLS